MAERNFILNLAQDNTQKKIDISVLQSPSGVSVLLVYNSANGLLLDRIDGDVSFGDIVRVNVNTVSTYNNTQPGLSLPPEDQTRTLTHESELEIRYGRDTSPYGYRTVEDLGIEHTINDGGYEFKLDNIVWNIKVTSFRFQDNAPKSIENVEVYGFPANDYGELYPSVLGEVEY